MIIRPPTLYKLFEMRRTDPGFFILKTNSSIYYTKEFICSLCSLKETIRVIVREGSPEGEK